MKKKFFSLLIFSGLVACKHSTKQYYIKTPYGIANLMTEKNLSLGDTLNVTFTGMWEISNDTCDFTAKAIVVKPADAPVLEGNVEVFNFTDLTTQYLVMVGSCRIAAYGPIGLTAGTKVTLVQCFNADRVEIRDQDDLKLKGLESFKGLIKTGIVQ